MNNESQIVLYQPDDSIRLEVKIDAGNETVWLNRNQIAELFGRDVKTSQIEEFNFAGGVTPSSKQYLLQGYSINRHLVAHTSSTR